MFYTKRVERSAPKWDPHVEFFSHIGSSKRFFQQAGRETKKKSAFWWWQEPEINETIFFVFVHFSSLSLSLACTILRRPDMTSVNNEKIYMPFNASVYVCEWSTARKIYSSWQIFRTKRKRAAAKNIFAFSNRKCEVKSQKLKECEHGTHVLYLRTTQNDSLWSFVSGLWRARKIYCNWVERAQGGWEINLMLAKAKRRTLALDASGWRNLIDFFPFLPAPRVDRNVRDITINGFIKVFDFVSRPWT